ncbi:MAG: PqqD family protein [Deltaproteobacteria bacterium]|nr:PqqD family protein [Deltaproteobacteria bacterium]
MTPPRGKPGQDLLELRPATARKWERGEDGLVRILVPRFTGLLGRWIMPRLKKPYLPIRLDETGSFIWEKCNGALSGREIARDLEKRFPTMENADQRLAQFLGMLFAQAHVVNTE